MLSRAIAATFLLATQAQGQPLSPEQQARALAGQLAQAQQVLLSMPDLLDRVRQLQAEVDELKKPKANAKPESPKE